jgi:hypothetical protein
VERGDGWVQLQVDTAEFFPYPGREYEVSYKAAITRPFNMPLESWYSGNLKIEVPPSIGPYEIVSNRGSKLKPISKVGRSGQEGRIPDIDEGECLGVDLLGSEIAPSIYLRNCEHRENQKWYLEADGSLRGLAGKCLTAALSTTGVVDIKLMDCEYPADQQWEFTPAGEIRIKGGDSCLDVQDGNPPRVILSRCTGADSQKWSKRPRASWLPSPGPPNMHILPLDISGRWKSSTGLTYEITQTGNTFEWSVVEGREKAKGTIDGKNVSAVWNNGANSAKGTITSQETNGKALKIQWDNGVVFERVVKGILTPLPPPKKIPVKPIEQSR